MLRCRGVDNAPASPVPDLGKKTVADQLSARHRQGELTLRHEFSFSPYFDGLECERGTGLLRAVNGFPHGPIQAHGGSAGASEREMLAQRGQAGAGLLLVVAATGDG